MHCQEEGPRVGNPPSGCRPLWIHKRRSQVRMAEGTGWPVGTLGGPGDSPILPPDPWECERMGSHPLPSRALPPPPREGHCLKGSLGIPSDAPPPQGGKHWLADGDRMRDKPDLPLPPGSLTAAAAKLTVTKGGQAYHGIDGNSMGGLMAGIEAILRENELICKKKSVPKCTKK